MRPESLSQDQLVRPQKRLRCCPGESEMEREKMSKINWFLKIPNLDLLIQKTYHSECVSLSLLVFIFSNAGSRIFPPFIVQQLDDSFLLQVENHQRDLISPRWAYLVRKMRVRILQISNDHLTYDLMIDIIPFGAPIPYPLLSSRPPICIRLQSRCTM